MKYGDLTVMSLTVLWIHILKIREKTIALFHNPDIIIADDPTGNLDEDTWKI